MHWKIVAVKHKRIKLGSSSLKKNKENIKTFIQIVRTLSHHELLHHLEVPVLGGQVEASVAELVSLIHVNALD